MKQHEVESRKEKRARWSESGRKEDNSTQVLLEEKIEIKITKMLSELNTYREQLATATLICYYITSDNIFMPIMLL